MKNSVNVIAKTMIVAKSRRANAVEMGVVAVRLHPSISANMSPFVGLHGMAVANG